MEQKGKFMDIRDIDKQTDENEERLKFVTYNIEDVPTLILS